MTKKIPSKSDIENIMMSWPGKRGIDIPENVFDRIQPVAQGISKQIWGSNVQPEHLQYLYDNGYHTPEAIQSQYDPLPHPHAPSVTVGEYQQYSKATELFNKHQK